MIPAARLRTFLWFKPGQLEEAVNFYQQTFGDVVVTELTRPEPTVPVTTAEFSIAGQNFVGMAFDGGPDFNDSISISVECDGQAETDRLWEAITREGEELMCGWCRDKWGLTWQISPKQMNDWLRHPDPAVSEYAWAAMGKMRKIIIDDLHV